MASIPPNTKIPGALQPFFANPPIMVGETVADYWALLIMLRDEIEPQNRREWLLVKDIVDAEWELLRLNGMKVNMLHAVLPRVAEAEVQDNTRAKQLREKALYFVTDMFAGDGDGAKNLEEALIEEHLTTNYVTAIAFERSIGPQLKTDQMINAARARANSAYRQLDTMRAREASLRQSDPLDDDDQTVDTAIPDAVNNKTDPRAKENGKTSSGPH